MKLMSKKKLFAHLEEIDPVVFEGVVERGLGHRRITNETYGPKSMIYVHTANTEFALVIIRALRERGWKIKTGYLRHNPGTFDVRVSYFKGHHWDE